MCPGGYLILSGRLVQINTRTVFGALEPSKFDIASRRKNFRGKQWGADGNFGGGKDGLGFDGIGILLVESMVP